MQFSGNFYMLQSKHLNDRIVTIFLKNFSQNVDMQHLLHLELILLMLHLALLNTCIYINLYEVAVKLLCSEI